MGKKNNKKKKQEKEAKKAEEEEAEFDRMLKEVKQDDPDQGTQVAEPPPAAVRTRGLVSVSALCNMNPHLCARDAELVSTFPFLPPHKTSI